MAEQVVNFAIPSPGIKGLNTESTVLSDPLWADQLVNWTYNGLNEIQARNGYQHVVNTTYTDTIKSIYEYTDATGVTRFIVGTGSKIYSVDSLGNSTDITGTVTATDGNWQFATFNDKCVGYQNGHAPIELANNASTFAPAGGTQYNGSMCHVSGGRIWTVYDNTLYYTDLLINSYAGGSSGSFDLDKYWPSGNDTAAAITEHNGFLFVFGKQSIIIYSGSGDPTAMQVADTIAGVGCIARDSVQVASGDLFFLSSIGIVAMSRVIQEKSIPSTEASRNIRKDMIRVIAAETSVDNIKAAYNDSLGLYLISFPTSQLTYLLDTTGAMEDGTYRMLQWDLYPTAMVYSNTQTALYFSQDTGKLQKSTGTLDGVAYDGSGGSEITCTYVSTWTTLSPELSGNLKIAKSASVLASGTADTITLGVAYDFKANFYSVTATQQSQAAVSKFGVAQYSVDKYTGLFSQQKSRVNLTGTGDVLQFKITAKNPSRSFSIKQLASRIKIGRLTQ